MMEELATVNLVLRSKWFDLTASGEKTVEYRKITPYWTARLRCIPSPRRAIFRRGYTDEVLLADINHIDVGPCPYEGMPGEYYRIHFNLVGR